MANRCQIDVRFFRPPPELDGHFSSFYRAEIRVPDGGRVRDHLQPEWGNVRFFFGDSPDARLPNGNSLSGARFTATGPSSMPTEFHIGPTRFWGIGLFPLGWARYMPVTAAEMANTVVDGETHPAFGDFTSLSDALFGSRVNADAEYAIITAHFIDRLKRKVPDEGKIAAVHAALVDPEVGSVGEFAELAGIGQRTLERVCRRHFGFAPSVLLRRQRFMRSLAAFMLAPKGNWTSAIDGLYHDQAHFVRDFKGFMGMTPSEYAALDHPVLGAFMQERARIWGAAAQTLDIPHSHAPTRVAPPE